MFADCGAEMTGSFTPKMMHAFLREVIKVGRPPAKGVPAIKRLALDLNRIQEGVRLWFVWRDRLVGKVDKAIQDLNKALPELLQPYDCEAKLPVDYSWTTRVPIPSKRYDDHVIFLRRLLAATQEARQCRERHLPFTPGLLPKTRLRDIKNELQEAFLRCLGREYPEACYQFIAAVLPDITGEKLTARAVKDEIIKKR